MDSTVQLFEFMGVNRSLFVQWVLIGTLTSLVVVYVAHTFRNLPTPVRAGAMVSSIIGIISFGQDLVMGRKRVPNPPTGKTAVVMSLTLRLLVLRWLATPARLHRPERLQPVDPALAENDPPSLYHAAHPTGQRH